MSTPAAFSGTYSDWKLIKTRGVVQIVIEVPLAASGAAYEVLGGMPNAANEIWCAVALLKPEGGDDHGTAQNGHVDASPRQETKTGGARSWDSMSAAQQAGILCADKAFQKFASECQTKRSGGIACSMNEHRAAEFVRSYCDVNTRRDLDYAAAGNRLWNNLVTEYRAWQQHPELVG